MNLRAGFGLLLLCLALLGLLAGFSASRTPTRRIRPVRQPEVVVAEKPTRRGKSSTLRVEPLPSLSAGTNERPAFVPPIAPEDPFQLETWLLTLSDDEFRALVGTRAMDAYVNSVIGAWLEKSGAEKTISRREIGLFLETLNRRIRWTGEKR